MKTFVEVGDILDLPAPYARSSGQCAKIGLFIGVAQCDLANGETGAFKLTGVFDLPKVGSEAWTVGAAVYWDDTNKYFTTTSSGNTKAGAAVLAVGSGAGETTGRVRLNGTV